MDAMQEEFTVYAVEVCRSCGWNHLDYSYVLGAEARAGASAPARAAPGGHGVVPGAPGSTRHRRCTPDGRPSRLLVRRGSSPASTAEDATLRLGPSPSPTHDRQRGFPRVPAHDENSPVTPRAGSVRRPAPTHPPPPGGGGRPRPPAGGNGFDGVAEPVREVLHGPALPARPRAGVPARPAARPTGKATGPRNKKPRRKRRLKIAGIMAGLLVLLGVFVGVVYASTAVPSPDSITSAQTTVIYYSDGKTEMARLGDENRTNVSLDQVSGAWPSTPSLAAENRSFYPTRHLPSPGSSVPRGTTSPAVRAGRFDDHAAVREERDPAELRPDLLRASSRSCSWPSSWTTTTRRKKILENYLNTIYYGRGAYGIESAANTYFGVPAMRSSPRSRVPCSPRPHPEPFANDLEVDPEGAQRRWVLVLDAMVDEDF